MITRKVCTRTSARRLTSLKPVYSRSREAGGISQAQGRGLWINPCTDGNPLTLAELLDIEALPKRRT